MSDIPKYRGFYIELEKEFSKNSYNWLISTTKSIIVDSEKKKLKATARGSTKEECIKSIKEEIDKIIDKYPQAET